VALTDLPPELLMRIFECLDSRAIAPTCRHFHALYRAEARSCIITRPFEAAADAASLAALSLCALTRLEVTVRPPAAAWPLQALTGLRTLTLRPLYPVSDVPPACEKIVIASDQGIGSWECWDVASAEYPRACTWLVELVAALDAAASPALVIVPVICLIDDEAGGAWAISPRVRLQALSVCGWPRAALTFAAERFEELLHLLLVSQDVPSLAAPFAGGAASLPRLQSLTVSDSPTLAAMGGACLPALEIMRVSLCPALTSLRGLAPTAFPRLLSLSLQNCEALTSLRGLAGAALSQLIFLTVRLCPLETLDGLQGAGLQRLAALDLTGCAALRCIAALNDAGLQRGLTKIVLRDCSALRAVHALRRPAWAQLEVLDLAGCAGFAPAALGHMRSAPLAELTTPGAAFLQAGARRQRAGVLRRVSTLMLLGGGFAALGDLRAAAAAPQRAAPRRSTAAQRLLVPLAPPLALRRLVLSHCDDLAALCDLGGLASLSLASCGALTSLSGLHATALTQLELTDCQVASLDGLAAESLQRLSLSHCGALTCVRALSAAPHPALQLLQLRYCYAMTSLEGLAGEGAHGLTSLTRLEVTGCVALTSLRGLRDSGAGATLRLLQLRSNALARVSALGPLPALRTLEFAFEDALESIAGLADSLLPSLVTLKLWHCPLLTSLLGVDCAALPSLETVSLRGCSGLTCVTALCSAQAPVQVEVDGCEGLGEDVLAELRRIGVGRVEAAV